MKPDDYVTLKDKLAEKDEIISRLCERVTALERKLEPAPTPPAFVPGPRGPTTTELAMSRPAMSREAMQRCVDATPNDLMLQIRSDRAASAPASLAVKPGALTPAPDPNPKWIDRSGWREAVPLRKWRS